MRTSRGSAGYYLAQRRRRRQPQPRPALTRVCAGHWRSKDGRWTFKRHWSDPHPQRWFAYLDDDDYPANEGSGHTTLAAAANWTEGQPC